ncbi:DUF3488 and transglutaminase-like domain-containing protein [Rubripirellula sp.]|nr:DUF3488 and transglutaminase-like domain-containing protein [Rubripirellula sp.]
MSSAESNSTEAASDTGSPIVKRLQFYFAAVSCLSGLVLATGSDTDSIPIIAVFFSLFGYVFVDYLRLFALPPIAAYAAMAVAALYSVSHFADLDAPGNHQMVAVAQLLVFVQAILMLQRKSRRIFEQLGVFCLLELIVAAVFNDAINYGLLLLPIAMLGACALSLLAAVSVTEGLNVMASLEGDDSAQASRRTAQATNEITVRSPETVSSLTNVALRLPRISLMTLAPPVFLVAAIFFYALPRTSDAMTNRKSGTALVGFNDTMSLEQIGQMQQSTARALRIYLSEADTETPYRAESLYLRGRVLDRYAPRLSGNRNTATWTSSPGTLLEISSSLPPEFIPQQSDDKNFYDSVAVSIVCESMRSNSLFAIAPYHRIKSIPNVLNELETWTLSRKSQPGWIYPRKNYQFGTHAFRNGQQSDLISRFTYQLPAGMENASRREILAARNLKYESERRAIRYQREILQFDVDAIPTAAQLGQQFSRTATGQRRSNYDIAQAVTDYLSTSPDFNYTLNLDAESLPGIDPIEQFLSVDRKGNCQYFASALAMILRSQRIPARIVVGYCTDEFNEPGQHYVARQLHAHSWVEALIDHDDLIQRRNVYGQPKSKQYWLRLDPTPIGGRRQDSGGGAVQYLDAAQNAWDDYVVDMDAARQQGVTLQGGVNNPMTGSYSQLVEQLSAVIAKLRSGELGGGSLASGNLFSWQAAVVAVILAMLVALAVRIRPPKWFRRRLHRETNSGVERPKVEFYALALDQLARVGIDRQATQTPEELRLEADELLGNATEPISQPLSRLTSIFYRMRFGITRLGNYQLLSGDKSVDSAEAEAALCELTHGIDRVIADNSQSKSKGTERNK